MKLVFEAEEQGTKGQSRAWRVEEETNRLPEWVYMRLEPGDASKDSLELRLSVNFNEHYMSLLGSRITYGLTAGDLTLNLSGGSMPYADREPKTPLAIHLPVERTVTDVSRGSSKAARSAAVDIGVFESKGKGSAKIQSQREKQGGVERQTTDKFSHVIFQLTTKGSETQPIWSFELKSADFFLKGRLDQYSLGVLRVRNDACRILATFETMRRHIRISGGDGIWPDDLGRNKRAVTDVLIKRVLAKRLVPFLSRMEVRYG